GNRRRSEREFVAGSLIPLCIGTLALTYFWALDQVPIHFWPVVVVSTSAHALIWFVVGFLTGTRKFRPWTWIAAAASGAIVGLGLYTFMKLFEEIDLNTVYITFAFPLVLAIMLFGLIAFIAFAGGEMGTDDLEWYGRSGAWVCVVMVGWIAICGV